MNPFSRVVLSSVVWLALSLFPLAGCDDNSPGAKPGSVGQVTLSIEDVPADVACLRISATGTSRQVVRDLDVTVGQSVSESFSGLPIGTVVFQAAAYSQICDKVTSSTVPSWISDETSHGKPHAFHQRVADAVPERASQGHRRFRSRDRCGEC